MSLWPLMKESQMYTLKCPKCSNERQFRAVTLTGQLLWICAECGQDQDLLLIPVAHA